MDHPRPWLRYVDADDLDDSKVKFDGFDRGEFEKLTDADLKRMDDQMAEVCCASETIVIVADTPSSRFDARTHYRSPGWWDADFYRPDRADTTAKEMAGTRRS